MRFNPHSGRGADSSRSGLRQRGRSVGAENSITLRLALASDEHELARLAALDSSKTPVRPVLLVLVNRQPLAAISLTDGTVVADPFQRTAELVELLHARSRQLTAGGEVTQPTRPRWTLRARAKDRRRPAKLTAEHEIGPSVA